MNNIVETINVKVLIVGGGPIGLFAFSKFKQANFDVLLIESSNTLGGQCNLYLEKTIHNIPLVDNITPNSLIKKILQSVENNDLILLNHKLCSLEVINEQNEQTKYIAHIQYFNNGEIIEKNICCQYVILACGNGKIEPNKLQILNAELYENKTLFYDVKNKHLFKNKNIILNGGGDSILDWCIELYGLSNSITVITRRNIEKPDNQNFLKFKQLIDGKKVNYYNNHNIKRIIGDTNNGKINSIEIENISSKEVIEVNTDYLLLFFGLKSNKMPELQDFFYVNNDFFMSEKYKNVFSIGDCANYNGKMKIIPIGFTEAIKCFTYICNQEKNGINIYGKKITN